MSQPGPLKLVLMDQFMIIELVFFFIWTIFNTNSEIKMHNLG